MVLQSTYVKQWPCGDRATMARILCPCGKTFEAPLSRWRHALFDSCRPCGLKRSKKKGFGLFGNGKNLVR
jgi:hypothetical protein